MEETNYMLKCRALFLYNIALMSESNIELNDYLNELLLEFFRTYGCEYFDLFELILCFEQVDVDDFEICEEDEWQSRLYEYLKPLCLRNNDEIVKLYNEIGNENVSKICELAELFYEYLNVIVKESNLIKVRS